MKKLDKKYNYDPSSGFEKPANLELMLELDEKLAEPFYKCLNISLGL